MCRSRCMGLRGVLSKVGSPAPSLERVEDVTLDEVRKWACGCSQVSLVLLGAGPPCQGVSGLNADRKGALKDHRSCLSVMSGVCVSF